MDSFSFKTRKSAANAAEMLAKATGVAWHVAKDGDTFLAKRTQMKTVKNLMTGKMIEIPEDTPYACDPSTERYWTM